MYKKRIVYLICLAFITSICLSLSTNATGESFALELVEEFNIDVGYSIRIEENYAYITDNDGICIFDVSDPTDVVNVQNIPLPSGAFEAYVENGIAYVAGVLDGFYIINVTDILLPEILSNDNSTTWAGMAFVQDNLAFITYYYDGLFIYDISNKSDPIHLSTYYTGDNHWGAVAKEEIAYLANPSIGIEVLNITDPTAPVRISVLSSAAGVTHLSIEDDYLYIGKHGNGLNVFDITNPVFPELLGSYDDSDGGEELGVRGNGTHMVVADNSGIELFDLTGLPSMSRIAEFRENVGGAHDVEIKDNYIFAVDGEYGFFVLEIVEQQETTPSVTEFPLVTSLSLLAIISLRTAIYYSKRKEREKQTKTYK